MFKTDTIKVLLGRFPLADKAENLLRFSLTLILALLIANNLANLSWQLFAPFLTRKTVAGLNKLPEQRSTQSAAVPASSRTAEEIALFGRADASAASTPSAQLQEAPPTTLNMILKGVIAAHPMSRALAIIAEKGKSKDQLYGLGDTIPGNATIRVIYPDRVIINRSGVLETLFLEGSQPPGTPGSSQSGGNNRSQLASNGNNISSRGGGAYDIRQGYWNKRLADLPGISREVGVQIYHQNGRQVGYKLVSARGSHLLNSLGLKPGDILVSVDGRAMSNLQNGLAAYQSIRKGGQVRIEIIRHGKRESRVYNIGD